MSHSLRILLLLGLSLATLNPATGQASGPTSDPDAHAAPADVHAVTGDQTGTSITVQTAKGEIGDVLRMVAVQGGLNLVIGPEVKGEVSAYLEDVDVNTALKSIAVHNGFDYTVEDGVITVSKPEDYDGEPAPPPLVTRVFSLRSQDANRVKDALEFALSKHGKMKVLNENSDLSYGVQNLSNLSGNINGGVAGNGTATAVSGTAFNGQQQQFGGLNSRFGGTGGAIDQIPAYNARKLVVTDIKENVDQIADLIADLDKLPPQVLIEARIVEMSTDLQRRLGIDWSVNALANGPILNHQWPLANRAGFASGAEIMRGTNGNARINAGLALGSIDLSQFTALLQANQTDNAIRLLANPRLLVYNNHSASILVGERYPILQATITDFGTVTEAFSEYIPVGVQLEVTPTIMMDGRISMLVHPATSALGDDVVGTTGLRVARIRTRELDTRVIMQDGQTIALGGLISDRKIHQARKVPGLGDVPILDILFRQENPQSERVDLLVFLTAHVEAATEIDERDQRVLEMYRPHFKHIERLQDVPLHFEIPTEYEPPKPMFSDPPVAVEDEFETAPQTETAPAEQKPTSTPYHDRRNIKAASAGIDCNAESGRRLDNADPIEMKLRPNPESAVDEESGFVIRIDPTSTDTVISEFPAAKPDSQRQMHERRKKLNALRQPSNRAARRSRTLANSGARLDETP